MAGALQFDSKDSQLVFGGKLLGGYMSGTYISIVRNADMWTTTVGADSLGTRVKSNNFSGRITVTLQETSPSNDDLQAIANSDELNNDGALPLFFKHGNFIATAVTAWIVKRPDSDFANDLSPRVWVLETENLTIVNAATNS